MNQNKIIFRTEEMLYILKNLILILTGISLIFGQTCEVCNDLDCPGKMEKCTKANSELPFTLANENNGIAVEFGCLDLEYSWINKCSRGVRRKVRKCVELLENYSICDLIGSKVEVYKCVINGMNFNQMEAVSSRVRSSDTTDSDFSLYLSSVTSNSDDTLRLTKDSLSSSKTNPAPPLNIYLSSSLDKTTTSYMELKSISQIDSSDSTASSNEDSDADLILSSDRVLIPPLEHIPTTPLILTTNPQSGSYPTTLSNSIILSSLSYIDSDYDYNSSADENITPSPDTHLSLDTSSSTPEVISQSSSGYISSVIASSSDADTDSSDRDSSLDDKFVSSTSIKSDSEWTPLSNLDPTSPSTRNPITLSDSVSSTIPIYSSYTDPTHTASSSTGSDTIIPYTSTSSSDIDLIYSTHTVVTSNDKHITSKNAYSTISSIHAVSTSYSSSPVSSSYADFASSSEKYHSSSPSSIPSSTQSNMPQVSFEFTASSDEDSSPLLQTVAISLWNTDLTSPQNRVPNSPSDIYSISSSIIDPTSSVPPSSETERSDSPNIDQTSSLYTDISSSSNTNHYSSWHSDLISTYDEDSTSSLDTDSFLPLAISYSSDENPTSSTNTAPILLTNADPTPSTHAASTSASSTIPVFSSNTDVVSSSDEYHSSSPSSIPSSTLSSMPQVSFEFTASSDEDSPSSLETGTIISSNTDPFYLWDSDLTSPNNKDSFPPLDEDFTSSTQTVTISTLKIYPTNSVVSRSSETGRIVSPNTDKTSSSYTDKSSDSSLHTDSISTYDKDSTSSSDIDSVLPSATNPTYSSDKNTTFSTNAAPILSTNADPTPSTHAASTSASSTIPVFSSNTYVVSSSDTYSSSHFSYTYRPTPNSISQESSDLTDSPNTDTTSSSITNLSTLRDTYLTPLLNENKSSSSDKYPITSSTMDPTPPWSTVATSSTKMRKFTDSSNTDGSSLLNTVTNSLSTTPSPDKNPTPSRDIDPIPSRKAVSTSLSHTVTMSPLGESPDSFINSSNPIYSNNTGGTTSQSESAPTSPKKKNQTSSADEYTITSSIINPTSPSSTVSTSSSNTISSMEIDSTFSSFTVVTPSSNTDLDFPSKYFSTAPLTSNTFIQTDFGPVTTSNRISATSSILDSSLSLESDYEITPPIDSHPEESPSKKVSVSTGISPAPSENSFSSIDYHQSSSFLLTSLFPSDKSSQDSPIAPSPETDKSSSSSENSSTDLYSSPSPLLTLLFPTDKSPDLPKAPSSVTYSQPLDSLSVSQQTVSSRSIFTSTLSTDLPDTSASIKLKNQFNTKLILFSLILLMVLYFCES